MLQVQGHGGTIRGNDMVKSLLRLTKWAVTPRSWGVHCILRCLDEVAHVSEVV
jgi:hypothetical protein